MRIPSSLFHLFLSCHFIPPAQRREHNKAGFACGFGNGDLSKRGNWEGGQATGSLTLIPGPFIHLLGGHITRLPLGGAFDSELQNTDIHISRYQ